MAENKVKKIKLPSSVLTSVLLVLLGAILLFFPGESLDLFCRVAGILVLCVGIIQVIFGITGRGTMPGQMNTVTGAIIAIIGLFIIIRPDILVSILPFVAGVLLIIHGVSSLVNSCQLIGVKYNYWWVGILLSILSIVLGVILFFNAHSAAEFIAKIVGLFLIYSGISHLWVSSRKSKAYRLHSENDDIIDVEANIIDE